MTNKTQPTDQNVEAYLHELDDERKREDSITLLELMQTATGREPKMWGTIIGFGQYHYVYDSGREGDWFLTGFAPRKRNLSVYIMDGFDGYDELMGKLGKHKTGKSCLYINKLADVDLDVLRELVQKSLAYMEANYETAAG